MEMGCAVISGNLPLLRPYFEPFFRIRGNTIFTKTSSSQPSKDLSRGATGNLSNVARSKIDSDGFERISDDVTMGGRGGSGSDVELCDRSIFVKTDLTVTTEPVVDDRRNKKKTTGW
jgi:hypothetical protein